jgi:Mrp family chromosome partitioning ATPase
MFKFNTMFKRKPPRPSFETIAARVETEVGVPATLLVTSALENDGTTMIASRLADALINSGYRVALIDAREDAPSMNSSRVSHGGNVGADSSRTYASLALSDISDRFAGSRRDVAALVARLRARYDYVIVDAPSFTVGSLPTLFGDVCDALMIAVLKDRAATPEDRRINAYLDTSTKHTIGIVTATNTAIANFEAQSEFRSRAAVPLHEIADDRPVRVSVVTGSV